MRITEVLDDLQVAGDRARAHVDASHWGSLDHDCQTCRFHMRALGLDPVRLAPTRSGCAAHGIVRHGCR